MKARASAQPRLLASANDRQPVESQSQKPLKRPARKVVFNACENCRVRKTKVPTETFVVHHAQAANNNSKCSGTAPCTYCTANQIDCIFTGRAHERTRRENIDLRQDLAAAQQDLHDTQRNLATSERELRACHQSLSTVRHELLECQHDLSTSQVMFLESQQHVRDYVMSLGNIFDLLRISKQSIDANLRQTAMKSQDAAEFLQKMSTLPADVQQEVNLLSSCYAELAQQHIPRLGLCIADDQLALDNLLKSTTSQRCRQPLPHSTRRLQAQSAKILSRNRRISTRLSSPLPYQRHGIRDWQTKNSICAITRSTGIIRVNCLQIFTSHNMSSSPPYFGT